MNIIVFKGKIGTLNYYIERFLAYVSSEGNECYICDVNDEKTFNCQEFLEFAERPETIMFTYNNFGIGLLSKNGGNFWKEHGIHVFDYIMDHPRNFDDWFLNPPCELTILALDKNHVDYIKRYFPAVYGAYFLPNGGTEMNSSIKYEDRDIDVLYMGSGQPDISSFPAIAGMDDGGDDFYNRTIQIMFENTMLSTEEAIKAYFAEKDMQVSATDLYELNENTAGLIENYVRRITKMEGMKALSDLGISVHIYGTKWIDSEYPFSDSIVIHNGIPLEELLEIAGHAKISLCFIPWFKRGCSEKNFDAMMNGALCVTDRSEYLMENYKDGYNLVFFDLKNPKQMAADVKWLLENPEVAAVIAKRGYETAKAYDTLEHRFKNIMEIIENDVRK